MGKCYACGGHVGKYAEGGKVISAADMLKDETLSDKERDELLKWHNASTHWDKGPGDESDYAKGGDVKGVHKSTHDKGHSGQSMAGYATREVHKGADVDKDSFKKYAKDEHKRVYKEMKGMRRDRKNLAEGGFAEDGVPDDELSGYHDMPMGEHYDYPPDIIDEIMMSRAEGYSEGGKVSNDVGEGQEADKEPNQFDVLVKDDDLEFSYDGENSGDEIGNEELDDEDRDVVSEIMKSRKKKDRMPHPA